MAMPRSRAAQSRLDSGRSWLVAAACSWCLFWTMIVNRCASVVFVSIINDMGVSREAASWPFSLLGAVSNAFGLVSGVLLRVLPLRLVAILGSVLVAGGILLSFAFYGIIGITIGIGIITAIGQGLTTPSSMIAINAHFEKYRATGSGISYIGSTLVAVFFPPLLVYLNDEFGLRYTLLIVGGMTLNAVAGSLLVAKPEDFLGSRRRRQPVEVELEDTRNENGYRSKDEHLLLNKVTHDGPKGEPSEQRKRKDCFSLLRKELSFMKRPIYYVIVVSGVLFAYNLVMLGMTIVDHGMGKGLTRWAAAALPSCCGAGGIVGRTCSGILSDKKICHRRDIMAVGFLVMCGALVAIAYGESVVILGIASVVFGVTSGSIMILFSVLMVEYFGLEKLPIAIGLYHVVIGLVSLPRPILIGYWRDNGSSYRGMYMFLATVSLGISLAWTVECFVKWRSKKTEIEQPTTTVELAI